jgi:hypothetical protein
LVVFAGAVDDAAAPDDVAELAGFVDFLVDFLVDFFVVDELAALAGAADWVAAGAGAAAGAAGAAPCANAVAANSVATMAIRVFFMVFLEFWVWGDDNAVDPVSAPITARRRGALTTRPTSAGRPRSQI